MKKIIIHWTAGGYQPSAYEKHFYHFLIDDKGCIYNGIYSPEANLNVSPGKYAAHCGGGNTGAIGVTVCAMAGFKNAKSVGKYPITRMQIEACYKLCAKLCKKYKIPIMPETVLTHYEFGLKNPKTSSAGKIDIIYLPPYPDVQASMIGDFIRSKILWYYKKL